MDHESLPAPVSEYLKEVVGTLDGTHVETVKSAQQRVWIISRLPPPLLDSQHSWKESLEAGSGRAVVRQWKSGARWWNLNRKQDILGLARAEVAGYQIAREALPSLLQPLLLHAVLAPSESWAIFSYVGHESQYYSNSVDDNNGDDDDDDDNGNKRKSNRYYVDGMIKIRHEFGFDEPHPRWGRVPENECQEYTLKVLRAVTIPLHKHITAHRGVVQLSHQLGPPLSYKDMVQRYREALGEMTTSACTDDLQQRILAILDTCIIKLESSNVQPLPPVLVHMDCQPQNLLFSSSPTNDNSDNDITIESVLDWEEAAYADPRFELLLLGRKVCANRQQADIVWKTYQDELPGSSVVLGPIEPWLQLETVHSVTTLLLQSMSLGGRSPWETKPDLFGKIQRECRRLVGMGWDFCKLET